jgi:hypothetical protein
MWADPPTIRRLIASRDAALLERDDAPAERDADYAATLHRVLELGLARQQEPGPRPDERVFSLWLVLAAIGGA